MFRSHYVYCLLLSLSLCSSCNLTIQKCFVDHQWDFMEKRNIFYILDKICAIKYICLIKLFLVSLELSQQQKIWQYIASVNKIEKKERKELASWLFRIMWNAISIAYRLQLFSSKLQKPSSHPHLQYSTNTVSAKKKLWLI